MTFLYEVYRLIPENIKTKSLLPKSRDYTRKNAQDDAR